MKIILILFLIAISGCSTYEYVVKPASIIKTPFTHLSPELQKAIAQNNGDIFIEEIKSGKINPMYATCGKLVYVGPKFATDSRGVLEDGPETYYDNYTGKIVANCGFWYCASNNDYCRKNCPPKGWSCL